MAKTKKTKEETKVETKVETLKVRLCEEQTLWVVRDSIDIEVSEYPELEGMTEEEMIEYVKENAYDMAAPSYCEWADSLYDALSQQDVIREKDTNNDTFIYVNE